jgi:hypothetical protein
LMRLTSGWLSVGVAPFGPGRQHVLSLVDRNPPDEIRTSLHGLRQWPRTSASWKRSPTSTVQASARFRDT